MSDLPDDFIEMVKQTVEPVAVTRAVDSFLEVKPGDIIVRHFYGTELELVVSRIDDDIIYTKFGDDDDYISDEESWMFYRDTGFEYDPELGATKENNFTFSWLVSYHTPSETE